jgi:hypothetical protein
MLDHEAALMQRIREHCPDLLGVYGAGDFAMLEKSGRPSPCAYVIYGGFTVQESSSDAQRARVSEKWLVVLSLKHAAQHGAAGPDPVRQEAAAHITAVISAVMGWCPDSSVPFTLEASPRPEPMPSRLLFPLAFSIDRILVGADDQE